MYHFILIYALVPNFPTPPPPSVSTASILSETPTLPITNSVSIFSQAPPPKCTDAILKCSISFNFKFTNPSTHPLTHPSRLKNQEDLSLLIFFNMSGNKTTNCPKNMDNMPRITGMLPKFTDTLLQIMSVFPGNMPRFLGQLTLIKSVFHWR